MQGREIHNFNMRQARLCAVQHISAAVSSLQALSQPGKHGLVSLLV